jgi:hypothetical protein
VCRQQNEWHHRLGVTLLLLAAISKRMACRCTVWLVYDLLYQLLHAMHVVGALLDCLSVRVNKQASKANKMLTSAAAYRLKLAGSHIIQ